MESDMANSELTPELKAMLETALEETLQTFTRNCQARMSGSVDPTVEIDESAKRGWLEHYRPRYLRAITSQPEPRIWSDDREKVLRRAGHVRDLVALFAVVVAAVRAIRDSGAGELDGHQVTVEETFTPVVTQRLAELASTCIDCSHRGKDDVGVYWEWCSRDGEPGRKVGLETVLTELLHEAGVNLAVHRG
jgi:hypothetical protein